MEGVIALGCRAEGHTCRRGAWEYVCVDAAITIEQHDDCNEEVNEKQEDDKMAGHALVCLHLPYKEATQDPTVCPLDRRLCLELWWISMHSPPRAPLGTRRMRPLPQ